MSVPPVGTADVTRARAAVPAGLVVATVAGFALVALLGAGVRTGFAPQLRLDAAVSEALYAGDDRARALDWLLETLTAPGLSAVRLVLLLPVVVWLARRRAWRTVAWVVLSAGLVSPVTALLKDYFGRVRPPFDDGGARYESLSYPSGHSSGIAALVTVALVLAWPWLTSASRRLWATAGVVLVVLVGLTRMWLGVHYLSDVLGGWALGLSWCLLVAVLLDALPGGRAALPPR
ncbi:phosphatase PAP2 family protein [Blastococcus sp. TF02A_35]|uniref:phosphatase PAP2 family protein n=1 Tax=Blastococcus sp. TF02A-35 TaxID=2559612 RepID=UPI00107342B8|nr:phosphatase PAP2 family protein [Blastococcus sp. TF02A_35]TFV51896.1 phosphatase PAP2 family protein [Blastococcus sp. TF02A_35]